MNFQTFEVLDPQLDGDSVSSTGSPDVRPYLDQFKASGFKALNGIKVPLRRFNVIVGANRAELGRPRVVIWIRDTDGSSHRRQGWQDACEHAGQAFDITLAGFPHECMEAWLLAAWSPRTETERQRLDQARSQLGFWPHEAPERLSHAEHVPKSIKAVCESLAVDEAVLEQADLDQLRTRGGGCGLSEFLRDVADTLVPALRRG